MARYFLSDSPEPAVRGVEEATGCKVVGSPVRNILLLQWLEGCMRVMRSSRKNDIIVCWFDFQAVICWWLCKLTFRRRQIVAINLMLKAKPTLKNLFASWLYRKALRSDTFHASYTSRYYYGWLKHYLGIDFTAVLIHDVYKLDYQVVTRGGDGDYVFSGGGNARDWQMLSEIAQVMPNIKFRFVMRSSDYAVWSCRMPQNVTLKHEIPECVFVTDISNAAVVAMPLKTDAPAGLIALFMAAANDKYILMSDNVTTREYLTPDRGALVGYDIREWTEAIDYAYKHRDECKEKAQNLHRFLETQCNEQVFLQNVCKLLELCESKK